VILLFIVLLALPNPRLRGHARVREFFPTPSLGGSIAFALIVSVGTAAIAPWLTGSDQIDLARVFAFGIVALSLVPLAGFAGQVSLAQLSFAGIGAVTMAHLGQDGNPMGLVYAVLISAAVGALVALPALRLSGIYLALATAAFAVALERWVFQLPNFSVFGWFDVKIFQVGSVGVDRVELFGYAFDNPRRQTVLLAVVFSLLCLLVVAVRRSRFGRRLLAMKDSEAACATLGMNLVGTKLAVFAFSAGIAGLGGALYGGLLGSINSENFSFLNGLPIFMLTVVGGVGAIGGALLAGISLGMLSVLPSIVPSLENVLLVTPGLIGISLGRNPSGAVSQINEAYAPVKRSKPVLVGVAIAYAAIYVLRSTNVIDNWTTVWAAIAVLLLCPPVAEALEARAARRAGAADAVAEPEAVPLEWVGITRPFTDADVRELNAALALSEVEMYGAARR
jgi:branched-chain amino acid transport system permease protein